MDEEVGNSSNLLFQKGRLDHESGVRMGEGAGAGAVSAVAVQII